MSAEPLRGPVAPFEHVVHFYEDDRVLHDAVGRFLGAGLARGEAAIVIATEAHRRGFDRALGAAGVDLGAARAGGALVSLDAAETLSQFMAGDLATGHPDAATFRQVVGGLVERAGRGRRGVLAYGEMVSVLLAAGNEAATQRLELLWNELADAHCFRLYCAYPLSQFEHAHHAQLFQGLCHLHSHVVPAESYDEQAAPAEQHRQIAALQQRAQALEAEIAERRRVEGALRFVCEASSVLAGSLDYNESLARVAILAVRSIADWCAVDVVEPDGSLRRLAAASRDPRSGDGIIEPQPASARQGRADDPYGPWGVLGSGVSEIRSDLGDPVLRERGLKSFITAALKANGRVHGVLTLASARDDRRYDTSDLLLAEDLAGRAAVAIETARLCDELRRADRRKDEFLATLSHELRSPLNAIVGWAHLLRTGSLDADGARRALDTITRNAGAQNRLISDILDMQRLSSGKLRLSLSSVELDTVIDAALDTVRPAAQAKGLVLRAVLDRQAAPVQGDADRLQQVVWNLLSNAVKFTPTGGGIDVRLAAASSAVDIVVEDDGPGIAPDFLPYVFDRFRQADGTATRRHGGLGLGLAIARTLVELHGGTIEVSNRPQGGAAFRVSLPLRASPVAAAMSPAVSDAQGLSRAPLLLHGVRVLVVDDDVESREVLAGILGQCGAEVFVAVGAVDALPLLRRERPHVLLCDIEMPGEDGYNLVRKVRALPAAEGGAVPAAALTGHARPEDALRALSSGFQAHVPKPVNPEALAAVIARLSLESGRLGAG